MPTNIQIIHAREFIKATASGDLDFKASQEHLMAIAQAGTHLIDYAVLLDTRAANVLMSATDLWYLAAELYKLFLPFPRKTAVLCPVDRFDDAAFFALCAQNRSFNIMAFSSFEEAIDWLLAEGN